MRGLLDGREFPYKEVNTLRPVFTENPQTGDMFLTCPFEHLPDGLHLVYEEFPHPRGFLHTYEECKGIVPVEELMVWMAQQVSRAYGRNV